MSTHILIGSLTYFAIKFLGYSAYAIYLNKLFLVRNNVWFVGISRTLLGVTVGLLVNLILFSHLNVSMGRSPIGGEDSFLYLALLLGLRVFEWAVIIYFFYAGRKLASDKRWVRGIGFGILCSFALDIPLMLGLLMVVSTIC